MAMTTIDFDYLCKLVRDQSAIVLEPGKEYLLEARLATVLRQEGMTTMQDLVVKLRRQRSGPLHTQVVEAMTTNETLFFRDPFLFEAMRTVVLPDLIARRRAERKLEIWSAACSSGQEPYSIAMLLREHFREVTGWRMHILATDLSTTMLGRAREGRYSQLEVNRGLPANLLMKHFTRQGMQWVVNEDLRRSIDLRPLNLDAHWPPMPQMDMVLLRNVLIYFDMETKRRILASVRKVLRPDGCLFLGGAETLLNVDDAFERVSLGKTACYRLRGSK